LLSGAYSGGSLVVRNKIRLIIGWFGMLTPVYAAGVLTVLFATGAVEMEFVGKVIFVSSINFFIGRKLLKSLSPSSNTRRVD